MIPVEEEDKWELASKAGGPVAVRTKPAARNEAWTAKANLSWSFRKLGLDALITNITDSSVAIFFFWLEIRVFSSRISQLIRLHWKFFRVLIFCVSENFLGRRESEGVFGVYCCRADHSYPGQAAICGLNDRAHSRLEGAFKL